MQTVRTQILDILKLEGEATVGELADRLGMAPVSVRYHLDILQGDDLILASTMRREGTVGRPKQVYSLTEAADEHFPDNFAPLTAGVVRQMKQLLPAGKVEGAFIALAKDMAQPFLHDTLPEENAPSPEEDLDQRMARVVSFLNDRGYLARWEPETGQLHTHNCPYASVATEHRELCCMDLALIEALTGRPCERVGAIADNGSCCSYHLHPLNDHPLDDRAGQPQRIELVG